MLSHVLMHVKGLFRHKLLYVVSLITLNWRPWNLVSSLHGWKHATLTRRIGISHLGHAERVITIVTASKRWDGSIWAWNVAFIHSILLLFNNSFLDYCCLVKSFVVSKHEVRGQPLFSSQDTFNAKCVIELSIFKDSLIVINILIAFFIVIIIIIFIILLLIVWLHICFFGFWFRIKLILNVLNLPLQLLVWILHEVS